MTSTTPRAVVAALLASALLVACSDAGARPGTDGAVGTEQQDAANLRFVATTPADETTVQPTADPAAAAIAASRDLFDEAPVVVLAPAGNDAAADQAKALGAPLLVADGDATALTDELGRLGTSTVLAVGTAEAHGDLLAAVEEGDVEVVDDAADVPATEQGEALTGVLVLTDGGDWAHAAVASAEAVGATVRALPDGDPRADAETVDALAENPPSHVLALGDVFGDAERLSSRVAVAATGVQLPGGGQVAFPHRRMVALYGHPGSAALGVLGEQPVDEAVQRAREVAAEYEALSDVPVVPTFEIIATVASDAPGADGDYSNEAAVDTLRPWVEAARDAGIYVLLDLQPGTTDFLTQAKLYEELLLQPHVGLALDPEWRLKPGQRHMEQIGSVDAAEVNQVTEWLAGLTRENRLPQKVLVLHQFRLAMIAGRENLVTDLDEVSVVIHADGNGVPGDKMATWNALRVDAPDGVHWAWKNFYDEDSPVFTPEQTMQVEPAPLLISYQ